VSLGSRAGWPWPRQRRRLGLASAGTAALAFTLAYAWRAAPSVTALPDAAREIGGLRIAAALVAYLASHLLRAVRLALLIDDETVSLRALVAAQLYANGPSLALPFKLGELYRLLVFNTTVRNGLKTAVAIVTERILDFCVIFLALITLLASRRPALSHGAYFATLGTLFLLSVVVLLCILPENIETLQIYILRRHNTSLAVLVLTQLQRVQTYIREGKRLLSRKVATISLLSASIWALEIAAVLALFSGFARPLSLVLLALHIFLSGLLPAAGGLVGLPLAFASIAALGEPRLAPLAVVYQSAVFLPGVVLSLALCRRPLQLLMGRTQTPVPAALRPPRRTPSLSRTPQPSGNTVATERRQRLPHPIEVPSR
jgi:hypothetical protein